MERTSGREEVNLTRIGRIGWLLLLLCLFSGSALAARLPNRLHGIPVFPEAVRDPEREQVHRESTHYDETVVFSDVRVYTVNAIVDYVMRFYLYFTKATEGWPGIDAADVEPGETVGPWYSVSFYPHRIFEHIVEYGRVMNDGNWIRQAFSQRPQWKPSEWLAGGVVCWEMKEEDETIVEVTIWIDDMGYDWQQRIDYRSTSIVMDVVVTDPYMFADDWDELEEELGDLLKGLFENWPGGKDE